MYLRTFLVAAGLVNTIYGRPWLGSLKEKTGNATVYDYSQITPSENLTWVPCFDSPKLECANLKVPLDYDNPSAGYTSSAWIKYVSKNDSAQDIIFNPGGPGGSGIPFVVLGAQQMLSDFGSDYNLISFDPRGVNNSGIRVTCFPGELKNVATYSQRSATVPRPELYQSNKAYGQFCTKANEKTNAKYAGTVATVQDMMHFVSLRAEEKGAKDPSKAKIWYYGVSYGTVIGQTLAALYPDRIGRMVISGNVDSVEHYQGSVPSAVADTDKAYKDFFSTCFDAGPDRCAFHGNSTSAEDIEFRYLALLQRLREAPSIQNTNTSIVVHTDYSVAGIAFKNMYDPMNQWPKLAIVLKALEDNVEIEYYQDWLSLMPEADEISPYDEAAEGEALQLITCVDVNKNYTLENYEDYLDVAERFKRASYYFGDQLSRENLLMCAGMDISPPKSQTFNGFDPKGTNTSVPILFVNPTRDNITPLISAQRMSQYFPGSAVLAQDTTGHGYDSVYSACTNKYVQAYMKDASLPPTNTMCKGDVRPFFDAPKKRSILRRSVWY